MRVQDEVGHGWLGMAGGPAARAEGLVVTESKGDVIVYATDVHHIHHLNRVTAAIWRLCDGRRTVDDLVRLARMELGSDVDRQAVRLALTKLDAAGLLAEPLDQNLRLAGTSRRSLVKRAAVATAVPVLVSISAPSAAAATSHEQCVNPDMAPIGTVCLSGMQCCSNVCDFAPNEGRACRAALVP